MPVTVSYDLRDAENNQRTYIRSMFERFGWKRLGGSVFRYASTTRGQEDWLNDVVPALMFFRSYVLHHGIVVRYFTLDTQAVTHIDFSDPAVPLGRQPLSGDQLRMRTPTNNQSSEERIRRFVDSAADVIR